MSAPAATSYAPAELFPEFGAGHGRDLVDHQAAGFCEAVQIVGSDLEPKQRRFPRRIGGEGEDVRLVGVAHDGNEFVIAGESHRRGEPDTAAIRSSRDGVVWERQEPQPSVFGDGEVRLAAVWGSNGTVLMSGTGVHRASPLYYYDDPDTCRQPFPAL